MHLLLAALLVILLALLFVWLSYRWESFAGDKGYFQITWDPPSDTGGEGITIINYVIQISDKDGNVIVPSTTLNAGETQFNFGGEDDPNVGKWNTEYVVSIMAVNSEKVHSVATNYKFNSGDPPSKFSTAVYTDHRGDPLNVSSNPTGVIEATYTISGNQPAVFGDKESHFYVERDSKTIATASASTKSLSNNTYVTSTGGFSNSDISGFQSGDKVYFKIIYEEQVAGEPYSYTDSGKILTFGGPSAVQNISSEWINGN